MAVPRDEQSDLWAQVGVVLTLGFVLFACIGVGFLLGWYLDRHLNTGPVLSLVGSGLGLAGGLIEIIRVLNREEKRSGGGGDGSSRN